MFVAGKKAARVLALGIAIMGAATIMGAPMGRHTRAEAAAPAAAVPAASKHRQRGLLAAVPADSGKPAAAALPAAK
jgi:hypothetical protein